MKYKFIITLLFLAVIGYAQQLRKKVGSSPTIIQPSVALELESTNQGFLPPRMTQAQMQAISSPPTGLVVYCTDCSPVGIQVFNSAIWEGVCSGGGMAANCDGNGFIGSYINGFTVSGGTNTFSITLTNNSFATTTINFAASDLVLSGVAGLSVGTPTPSSATLNPSQSQQVSYPITGTPTSSGTLSGTWTNLSLSCLRTKKVVTCGAYTNAVPPVLLEFQCHNLGADVAADPFTPSWRLNGAYIQWGKRGPNGNWQTAADDGPSGFAAAPTSESNPNINDVSSWSTSIAADNAWNAGTETSPVKTSNDPCPSGYRVPTHNEWLSIYNNDTKSNWRIVGSTKWYIGPNEYKNGTMAEKLDSKLYLPAAGYRDIITGSLVARSAQGFYSCSTEIKGTNNAYRPVITADYFNVNFTTSRLFAMSVRCIKE